MHSEYGPGFGSGSYTKWNDKSKIKSKSQKNEMTTFWKTMLLLTLKSKKTNFYVYVYPGPEFSQLESRIEKVPDPHPLQRNGSIFNPQKLL
jgi:hypothetical protein